MAGGNDIQPRAVKPHPPPAAKVLPMQVGHTLLLPAPFGRCAIAAAWPARPDFALYTLRHARFGLLALKLYVPACRAQAARAATLQRQARGPFILYTCGAWQHARGTVVLESWACGPSLATLLDRERAAGNLAPLRETFRRAHVMAAAVANAHAAGVWHRDIKPDNFLLQTAAAHAADLRLADFGLARAAHTRCRDGAGTLAYQAPEVARGEAHSEAADIFSLAASMIEMLVGMAPYEAATENETLEALLAARPLVHEEDVAYVLRRGGASPGGARRVLSLLAQAGARQATKRPSAQHVADKLSRIVSQDFS